MPETITIFVDLNQPGSNVTWYDVGHWNGEAGYRPDIVPDESVSTRLHIDLTGGLDA
jgi:hypothetical protein